MFVHPPGTPSRKSERSKKNEENSLDKSVEAPVPLLEQAANRNTLYASTALTMSENPDGSDENCLRNEEHQFRVFAHRTTIHGISDLFEENTHPAIKTIWALVFMAVLTGLTLQLYQTIKGYQEEPTTTRVYLQQDYAKNYSVMQFCSDASRMLHASAAHYGVNRYAAQYLGRQWFSNNFHNITIKDIQSSLFLGFWKESDTDRVISWDEYRQKTIRDARSAREELRQLLRDSPLHLTERYKPTLRDFYAIDRSNEWETGGLMPFYVLPEWGEVVRGPYASPGPPYFVCWDIKGVESQVTTNMLEYRLRFYIRRNNDRGVNVLFFSPFLGDHDVFERTDYYSIEYPDREYRLRELYFSFSLETSSIARVARTKYQCHPTEDLAKKLNRTDMLRFPYNAHIKRCMDRCTQSYIEEHYHCEFFGAKLQDHCHQYSIMRHFLRMPKQELLWIFDQSLREQAINAFAGRGVTADGKSYLISSSLDKYKHVVYLIFRQIWSNASQECYQTCSTATPMCDSWKFSRQGVMANKGVYDENEVIRPKWNSTIAPNNSTIEEQLGEAYTLVLRISPLQVSTVYREFLLITIDSFIGNLGGLSGFYLGCSVLSIVQLFIYCVVRPLLHKRHRRKERKRSERAGRR